MTNRRGKRWTDAEVDELEYLAATYTDEQIGKQLGRTTIAIKSARQRYKIPSVRSSGLALSMLQVGNVLGDPNFARSWFAAGFNPRRTGRTYLVSETYLIKFMRQHPELWCWEKCDQAYFGHMLWFQEYKGKTSRTFKKRLTPLQRSQIRTLICMGYSQREIARKVGCGKSIVGYIRRKQYHVGEAT